MCLPAWKVARIKAQIVTKEELLDKANALLLTLLSNPNQSYRFEDGAGGAQQANTRKIEDAKNIIDGLEADINRLYSQLNGGGIVNLSLRRKSR